MYQYIPQGVCSKKIDFDVENGRLKNVHFTGGCPGNLQGISRLLEDMPVEEAAKRLRGIVCRNNTSCPDQLAAALDKMILKGGKA
ncbi:TIGR03905 family TSCPD domain-containing protein [Clostridium minihomine]|uniref:TIGR03905 family TSCPD domain-containing protein n=1 Tax=Clostridium minihomine TaxID=2045012 RepID=UPI000C7742D9|nr:TIGR03905 family TSCPD domain-containing protein [Clostridium minihomine]